MTDGRDLTPDLAAKTRMLRVFGPGYDFTARKAGGADAWVLTGLTNRLTREKVAAAGGLTPRNDAEGLTPLAALSVDTNLLVPRLVVHPCFRVTSSSETTVNGERLVAVEYEIDPDKKITGMKQLVSGRLVFDPQRQWVLREVVKSMRNGYGGLTVFRTTNTYTVGPQSLPFLREQQSVGEADNQTYHVAGRTVFEPLTEPPNRPDTAFTLAAYGIPEEAGRAQVGAVGSAGGQEQSTAERVASQEGGGWYWLLLCGGVGLVIVGVAVRLWATRPARERARA